MLCAHCQEILAKKSSSFFSHHLKECSLWPFGYEERLCILGALHHQALYRQFNSLKLTVKKQSGLLSQEPLCEFFTSVGCTFSPLPCFSQKCLHFSKIPAYYLVLDEMSSLLFSCIQNGWVRQNIHRLTVGWKSDEIGYGLFAQDRFAAGEVVGVYSGFVDTYSFFFKKKDPTYIAELFRAHLWSFPYVVDGKKIGNLCRFINHDTVPNVAVEYVKACDLPFLCIRTLQQIEPGEELCISYGEEFCKPRPIP